MCGIIGIVGHSNVDVRGKALGLLAHRGPDGEGKWQSKDGLVWLGHRRLAIIDPEGGAQPLSNEDGTIWITFNGCIYNYLELAQLLRQKGHRFKSHSDTEVIIHSYEEWGEGCIQRFIGMFAFAIWDGRRQVLFCARDRIGIKPFYYWQSGGNFIFASEIKALLTTGFFKPESYREAIEEYLIFQTVLGEKTLFKNVYCLLPGCYMIIGKNGSMVTKKQYWDLDFTVDYDNNEEFFVDHLQLLLSDAVRMHLRSDVTLGAHLSGGLDSSTIVCLAVDLKDSSEPLMTFTGGFQGSAYDETTFARLVAERARTKHHEIWPTVEDFKEYLPKIIYFMDEPAAGPGIFPQYMVSKLASEHVKVVLGGQGGDEIFGGYSRYLLGYLEECLKGAIEETEDTSRYVATLQTIIPNLSMLKQYIPMLRYFWSEGLFESQERRYFRLMDRSNGLRDIYNPDLFDTNGQIMEKFSQIFNGSAATSFLNRMLYFDLKVHLPALLQVEDRTSMAWGLESRVPLLDHRIVEVMASILPVIKFKGGQPKYLFRKAVKNIVPDEILHRKDKMGFPVPFHLWVKGPIRDFVNDVLFSSRAKGRGIFNIMALGAAIEKEKDFGRVIWGALCLELWFSEFLDHSIY